MEHSGSTTPPKPPAIHTRDTELAGKKTVDTTVIESAMKLNVSSAGMTHWAVYTHGSRPIMSSVSRRRVSFSSTNIFNSRDICGAAAGGARKVTITVVRKRMKIHNATTSTG